MVFVCFYPKQTDADEAVHVNPIMRLWNGQKFCSTLRQSHTLGTSCLFGSPSDDWLWCISTLLTAGNFSSGTCLSYDKHPNSNGNTCLPTVSIRSITVSPKVEHIGCLHLVGTAPRGPPVTLTGQYEIIHSWTPISGRLWARSGWQRSHFHNIRCYGNSLELMCKSKGMPSNLI